MKVKLNDNYPNDFLTVHTGQIFYKKNNTLGKESVAVEINPDNHEFRQLLAQKYLIPVEEVVETKSSETKIEYTEKQVVPDPSLIPAVGMTTKHM